MINFGPVPVGAVLPVFFSSYAGSTGASVTLTGLAVTDIEIYKGTSMTQRASDAGYALLDTDGIDVDGTTGIHAFSIDTGDNTDSGFFAAGSFYTVVVSAVTVDSQTVNFVAATFRLTPAESSAGVPKVDVSHFGGTAGTFSSGRPEVNTTHAAGTAWGSGAITAGSIAADAITAAKIADGATAEIATAVRTELATELARIDVATSTRLASVIYSAPPSAASVADAVWDEAVSGHVSAGTFGKALDDTDDRGARTVVRGTVTTGASTTSIPTSAFSPAGAAADQFKGRIVIFDNDTTTAALRGQATDITASSNSSTPTLTVTALTTTPASGDTFSIV